MYIRAILKRLQRYFPTFLTLVITSVLIYYCIHEIDIDLFLSYFSYNNIPYLLLAAMTTGLILILNTLQFRIFLAPTSLSFSKLFENIAVFSMLIHVIPFWGGHALLVYLLGHRGGIGKTKTVSAMALDQISEGFAKMLLFAVAAFYIPLPDWMGEGIRTFILVVLGAYTLMVAGALWSPSLTKRITEFQPTKWIKLVSVIINWAYHLNMLRSAKSTILAISMSVVMKSLECVAVFWVQKSLGVDLGFEAAILLVSALSLTTVLPLTPGRIGLFEGTAIIIYQSYGIDTTLAFTLGLFVHIIILGPSLLMGYLMSIKMGLGRSVWKRNYSESLA